MEPKRMTGKALTVILLSANLIAAALFLNSCNSQTKSTDESTTTTTTTNTTTVDSTAALKEDWEKFKVDANHQIADANDSIGAFKMRVKKLNGRMKAKYDHEIVMLQRKNDELKVKLDSFKVDSKDKWDDFKMKFDDDMTKLKTSLRDSTDVNQK